MGTETKDTRSSITLFVGTSNWAPTEDQVRQVRELLQFALDDPNGAIVTLYNGCVSTWASQSSVVRGAPKDIAVLDGDEKG